MIWQVPINPELPKDEAKQVQKEEQDKIDNAQALNEEQQAEKEALLQEVYRNTY